MKKVINSIKTENSLPMYIFKKSKNGETLYCNWIVGWNCYIVNDIKKQNELIDLEGYRYFLFFQRPPIMVLLLFIAIIIASVLSYFSIFDITMRELVVIISFALYGMSVVIYRYKIRKILKNTPKVSKKEVEI